MQLKVLTKGDPREDIAGVLRFVMSLSVFTANDTEFHNTPT